MEKAMNNLEMPLGSHLFAPWDANIGDLDIVRTSVTTAKDYFMVMVS